MLTGDIWQDYLAQFDYFGRENIRQGCEPRVMLQSTADAPSIILVHGLTDSAYYMNAMGRRFYEAGFNVFMPLLHMHGLVSPEGMKNVSLIEWKKNVDFAIDAATSKGSPVSLGGLSTGGALSVYAAYTDRRIDGALFLFSAALDLQGVFGELFERMLRGSVGTIVDSFYGCFGEDLVGENPYRYTTMDYGGAAQLSHLIKELDTLTGPPGAKRPPQQPMFAAHSYSDKTADIESVQELMKHSTANTIGHWIPLKEDVAHASVVLEENVTAIKGRKVLEKRYSGFGKMMNKAIAFARENAI